MNKKQVKRVNEKTAEVLVKWLQSIVPEEDKDKINKKNYKTFLPEAPYFIKEKSRRVSFFTFRWAKRKIKKLYKKGMPLKNIKDIRCLQELNQA
tara:strand:+ start:137 stop:418 length:282 start_codon:yes stop_codon:yes gene_type:complete